MGGTTLHHHTFERDGQAQLVEALREQLARQLAADFQEIAARIADVQALVDARDFATLRGRAISVGLVANRAMERVDAFAPGPQRNVEPVEPADDGRWQMPCAGAISQAYHWPPGPDGTYHTGVDIINAYAAPVYAPFTGTVVGTRRMVPNTAGYPHFDRRVLESALGGWHWLKDTYGSLVILQSRDGAEFCLLAHTGLNYPVGRKVTKGEIVGWTDNTGLTTGPHVHMERRGADEPGTPRDPLARM